ncbi:MAG: uracil-DNA glycosylase [Candidatus Marinimicrobia bacterium]|nr:uracil-DNA glycosylase [Candidatus Neomarinimicrobiota bacterium]MBL7059382.1 uracil-DNA glycosylase [Candidatus Neomarinimicrobiota bacterium]
MSSESSEDLFRYLEQTRELFGDELYHRPPESFVSDSGDQSFESGQYTSANLDKYREEIQSCQKCLLGETRQKFVFGVGDPHANLMLIGEAPGAEEDKLGEPFVGRAGKLLDKILAAIGRSREKDVFICNVLKCRPPKNRDPLPSEVELCESYLIHQIHLIKPKLIVALGRVAGKTLLKVEEPLKAMRGKLHDYHGTPLIVTYHPAALLRNSGFKPPTWEDFKWIRSILEGEQ